MGRVIDGRVSRADREEHDRAARRKAVIKYASEAIEEYEANLPKIINPILDEQPDDADNLSGLLGLEESYHE